jgi:hypothetical protein
MIDEHLARWRGRRSSPVRLLLLWLLLSALPPSVQAAALDITVLSGQTRAPIEFVSVSAYREDGDDWIFVGSSPTDREGLVSLDLPFGSGEVYELRARSQFDQRVKRSDPVAAPGAFTFTVGGAAVALRVWNVAVEAPVAEVQVTARRKLADGSFENYLWGITDQQGVALFDLPGVDDGEIYVFAASPWFSPRFAEVISDPVQAGGALTLPVARNTLTVVRAETGQPIVDALVRVYEVNAGAYPAGVSGLDARTDAVGRIFYDLAGVAEGRIFAFRVFDPLGDGMHHFSAPVGTARQLTLAVAPREPDPVPDRRAAQAVNRLTYGANAELLAHVESVGVDVFIEEQLNPETIDDSEFDAMVRGWVPGPQALYRDLHYFALFHASRSKRQLREVMTAFWNNHFNTDNNKVSANSTLNWEEHITFREVSMMRFREILGASAHSPAMIRYLDTQFSRRSAPNENYARELLELHTMGLDSGWTEADVREIARVFTGWRTTGFDARLHDDGDKVVLGYQIPGGGEEEGERVLDILAAHPSTARHVCSKLAEKFVADDPGAAIVDGCAATWLASDGDVRAVLRFLFTRPAFMATGSFRTKVKTPLEYVVGVLRALELPMPVPDDDGRIDVPVQFLLQDGLAALGMELFRYPVPTGFPERGIEWVSSAQSLARVQFVAGVVFTPLFDARDWFLARDLTSPSEMADHLAALMLNSRLEPSEKALLFDVLDDDANPLDIFELRSQVPLSDFVATLLTLPRASLQ